MTKETGSQSISDRIIELVSPLIEPLGYEIVFAEVLTHRQKTLRLFIDHRVLDGQKSPSPIGVEDCVRVARTLDEPLDQMTEIDALFKGSYELEVSSPGVDRPLRRLGDFNRFQGREARIHVYRPLTAEEMENSRYHERNPKQKHFLGVLKGVRNEKVLIALSRTDAEKPVKKKGKSVQSKKNALSDTNSEEEVMIPLPLISKANLEPKFNDPMFDDRLAGFEERE